MALVTVFKVEGNEYRFDDLTLGELAALEKRFACNWGELLVRGNADHGRAILTTFLARHVDRDQAAARIDAMTLAEYEDVVGAVGDPDEDDSDPKAGAGSKTTTGPAESPTS